MSNPAALEFLLTRRSRPARSLAAPAPDREALLPILTAGLRVPDHGKLEPWRIQVLSRAALDRLAGLAADHARSTGMNPDRAEKGISQFRDAPMILAVILSPKQSDKAPAIEQSHSAAAVCLSLVNAALASGWGASWLTGWPAHDPAFAAEAFGLIDGETVAGLVHIGTETAVPPERPRPELERIVSWIDA